MTELAPSDEPSPDWTSISHEVLCPLCEYNLRGLNTPRCPECGYPFAWPEILDQRRQNHPYLFEHHPERNFRSYVQTVVGVCGPRKFWTTLHPTQRSRLGRLFIFWLLGVLCLLPVSFAPIIALSSLEANATNRGRYNDELRIKVMGQEKQVIRQYGSVKAYLDQQWGPEVTTMVILKRAMLSKRWMQSYSFLIRPLFLTIPLMWPWLTFVALMIFQISMRRARVKPVHVLRCTLYCFDLIPFAGLVVIGSLFMGLFLSDEPFFMFSLLAVLGLNVLIGTYRIGFSYARYLRFDHPFATIIATQIIVILLVMTFLFIFDSRLTDTYLIIFYNVVFRGISV